MRTLIYDGSCGICEKTIKYFLKKQLISRNDLIAIKNLHQLKEVVEKYNLGLEKLDEIILIENNIRFNGYFAFKQLFRVSGTRLKLIFHLPLSDFFGTRMYKYVAQNRHLFSGNSHCEII